MHPSVFFQRALFGFGQDEIGQEAIAVPVISELHGAILAFCCIRKAAMVLKASLQSITA